METFEGGTITNGGAILVDCGGNYPVPQEAGSTFLGNPVVFESYAAPASKLVVNVDPAYVLVVTPDGTEETGCDSSDNIVNTIPGATIPSCTGGDETITIPNPVIGIYNLVITPYGKGIPFTVMAQTFNSGGTKIASETYHDSQNQRDLYLFLSSGGSVVVTSTALTPEFPFGAIIGVLLPFIAFGFTVIFLKRGAKKKSLEEKIRD